VRRALLDPAPDEHDRSMLDAFAVRYGHRSFGPLFVIVAAYREAGSIGAVLAAVPDEVGGSAVSTIVVDDGSDDGTADIAEASGAYVCRSFANRGQGAALRLGYQVAVAHGAAYVATIDADGQYDPRELEALLDPILDERADFVSGSRTLGRTYQHDWIRRLGVVIYAALIRVLTGAPVSDPSFGLRVMRSEVVDTVTLRQPQFQAAELLIATAMRGFRITERPGIMRERTAGASRKGPNLVYGYRFGSVVVSTWWRERRRRQGRRGIA
jgi:glycosyltransferase involved in cell wall biosynthesis